MAKKQQIIKMLIDTREQKPLDFSEFEGVEVETATLKAGDYSAAGIESVFAVERKSLEDLIGTLNYGFDVDTRKPLPRFNRELLRMGRNYPSRAIVVDAHVDDIFNHSYESQTVPTSIWGRVWHLSDAYAVPVYFSAPKPRSAYEAVFERSVAWYKAELEARKYSSRLIVSLARACMGNRQKWFSA